MRDADSDSSVAGGTAPAGHGVPQQQLTLRQSVLTDYKWLILILIFSFAIRCWFSFALMKDKFYTYDGWWYANIAAHVAAGDGLVIDAKYYRGPLQGDQTTYPTVFCPPLLPVLAAVICYLPGDPVVYQRLLMVTLGTLLVLMSFVITNRMFDRRTAYIAALFTAMFPMTIYYSSFFSTETLFALTILVFVYVSYRALREKTPLLFTLCGVAAAITCLTRPNGLAVTSLVLLYLVYQALTGRQWRQIACLLLGFLVCLFPIIARNSYLTGQLVPITAYGPYHVRVGNSLSTYRMYMSVYTPDFAENEAALFQNERDPGLRKFSNTQGFKMRDLNQYWLQETLVFAKDNPGKVVTIWLFRTAHFWWFHFWWLKYPKAVLILLAFAFLSLYFLALYAIVCNMKQRMEEVLCICLPVMGGFLGCLPVMFSIRHRYPILICPLLIMAALGLHTLINNYLTKHKKESIAK